jgi:hypothetical protein
MAVNDTILSFLSPNFDGVLFNQGNTRTPFISMISGNRMVTNHVRFNVGQKYTTAGGVIPDISERQSLIAPEPTFITRAQMENVTQIFHKSVAISYAKQSNMGTLQGLNVAGQTANPLDEIRWQVEQKLIELGRDMENTCINGTYQLATNDDTSNKTRGMNEAIVTNVKAAGGEPLGVWTINELATSMHDKAIDVSNLTLWCNATNYNQINADAQALGLTVIPPDRTTVGIQITTIIMPMITLDVVLGEFIPPGTAFLFNFGVINSVEQPVPGKGNFFLELLAKIGAGEKYQIFGQFGLDHGPEWFHGKITGLDTTFTPPVPA